jgi:hypothetical protein
MRFAAALVLLPCVLAACGSFSSSDSPASGVDAGVAEAGSEAGVPDGGATPAPGGWCASQTMKHAFCADFDDATPLTKIFGTISDSSSPNGVTLDSTVGSTHPGSLKFVIPTGAGDNRVFADVSVALSAKGFRCELDVEIDSAPTFAGSLVYVVMGGIEITVNETLTVTGGPNSTQYALPGTTWVRMGVVTDLANATVTVTENGVTVATRPLKLATPAALAAVHFGSIYATEAFTMRYDNITCDPL